MKLSTIKNYFIIFHFTIKNVLIDTVSPSSMLVDMSIVPPFLCGAPTPICGVHGAPSSGHHGYLPNFLKIDF